MATGRLYKKSAPQTMYGIIKDLRHEEAIPVKKMIQKMRTNMPLKPMP